MAPPPPYPCHVDLTHPSLLHPSWVQALLDKKATLDGIGGAIAIVESAIVTQNGSMCAQNNSAVTDGGFAAVVSGARLLLDGTSASAADNQRNTFFVGANALISCSAAVRPFWPGRYTIRGPICPCAGRSGNPCNGCPQGTVWSANNCSCEVSMVHSDISLACTLAR